MSFKYKSFLTLMLVFFSMIIKGYKKPLVKEDLWLMNKEDTSEVVVPRFEKQWKKQCLKANR